MFKPADIRLPGADDLPIASAFVGTLGKAELEFCAALVVRYHHVQGLSEWTPVSRKDVASLLANDPVVLGWARNPFWRPDPYTFFWQHGYIDGWNDGPDAKGTLTQKFFEAVQCQSCGSIPNKQGRCHGAPNGK